jgi:hypothetical protein
MSCQSVCKNSKYRRFCSYDPYHQDCNQSQTQSFSCKDTESGDKKCVLSDKPSGTDGNYKTLLECRKNCYNEEGKYGYNCEDKECVKVDGPQNISGWKYVDYNVCEQECNPSHSGAPRLPYF